MKDDITNYPLHYPATQPRTPQNKRRHARFVARGSRSYMTGVYSPNRKHTIAEGARELESEIRRMGGKNMIISTNLKVKANGLPYSGQRTPDDPGVAVYFSWGKRDLVFACDAWLSIEDNLWAIVKHIEALRGQERWGVGSLDQAFAGYAQLPDPDARPWWSVLGVSETASDDEIGTAYIRLAKQYHPDNAETGNADLFIQVKSAYDAAKGKV